MWCRERLATVFGDHVSEQTEQTPNNKQSYPPLIATNAVLQYLREIFMALDNISFQIRTTMNNIVDTNKNDVQNFVMKNPKSEGASDPVIEGVESDDEK